MLSSIEVVFHCYRLPLRSSSICMLCLISWCLYSVSLQQFQYYSWWPGGWPDGWVAGKNEKKAKPDQLKLGWSCDWSWQILRKYYKIRNQATDSLVYNEYWIYKFKFVLLNDRVSQLLVELPFSETNPWLILCLLWNILLTLVCSFFLSFLITFVGFLCLLRLWIIDCFFCVCSLFINFIFVCLFQSSIFICFSS